MKEYRITTQNLDYPSDNDCFIDPNDPIHELKKSLMLGGLGSAQALQNIDQAVSHVKQLSPDQDLNKMRRAAIRDFVDKSKK